MSTEIQRTGLSRIKAYRRATIEDVLLDVFIYLSLISLCVLKIGRAHV